MKILRDWSQIKGKKRGGAEKVLVVLKGGAKISGGSFYEVA